MKRCKSKKITNTKKRKLELIDFTIDTQIIPKKHRTETQETQLPLLETLERFHNQQIRLMGFSKIEARTQHIPQWLRTLLDQSRIELKAKIIDYNQHPISSQIHNYLQKIGFKTILDHKRQQIGNTCGTVAAWAQVETQYAHRIRQSWWTQSLDQTFNPHINRETNQ